RNGFFMNWAGTQQGEGFEYHLLGIGMALTVLIVGAGAWSIGRSQGVPHAPWHKTSALSPLIWAMLPPRPRTLVCATRQERFVSPRRVGRQAGGRRHAASTRAMPNDTLHTAAWPQTVSRFLPQGG